MIFNAQKELDVIKATDRLKFLIEKKKRFEITEKKPIRSLSQNSYLHLILAYYALEFGETADYIKQEVFKKKVNREIFEFEFYNRKTYEVRTEYKSTAKLDTKELTIAIERFKEFSMRQAGFRLPEPSDLAFLDEIRNEVTKYESLIYL